MHPIVVLECTALLTLLGLALLGLALLGLALLGLALLGLALLGLALLGLALLGLAPARPKKVYPSLPKFTLADHKSDLTALCPQGSATSQSLLGLTSVFPRE